MDLVEFNTHSFIVKIWLEEPAADHRKGRWRGHITHVPSGERRYLKNLKEVAAFIVPYLEAMGVKVDTYRALRSLFRDTDEPELDPGGGAGTRLPTASERREGRETT